MRVLHETGMATAMAAFTYHSPRYMCSASRCTAIGCHMEEPFIASTSGRKAAQNSRNFASRPSDITFGTPFSKTLTRSRTRKQVQRGFATRQESRKRGQQDQDAAEEEETQNIFTSGAAQFTNLVNTLLFGAASRIERGTSVCVSCRGTGTMVCKSCNATGVTTAPSSRGTSSSLKSLIGTKSKEKEWIVSNRCRVCKGHGRLECPNCSGLGKRYVVPPSEL